jgi:hypothetical protein
MSFCVSHLIKHVKFSLTVKDIGTAAVSMTHDFIWVTASSDSISSLSKSSYLEKIIYIFIPASEWSLL